MESKESVTSGLNDLKGKVVHGVSLSDDNLEFIIHFTDGTNIILRANTNDIIIKRAKNV